MSKYLNKITAEEEISLLKHPHFVGEVEGELGQALVPEHQEATFHGNYLPWKLGHACTVGTWELPKLIYSVLPPNSPPSSSESVQGWTIFSHFISWSCAERVLELQRSGPAYSQALESWWTRPHHVNRSQSESPEELSAAPSPRLQHTTDQHLAVPNPEPARDALHAMDALTHDVLPFTRSHAVSASSSSRPSRASKTCQAVPEHTLECPSFYQPVTNISIHKLCSDIIFSDHFTQASHTERICLNVSLPC